jgi:uncharacterized repeat protein (TIGR04138 family)
MNEEAIALARVLRKDRRYSPDAYFFVREALGFAADKLELRNCNCQDKPGSKPSAKGSAKTSSHECDAEANDDASCSANEHHVTGQQLCDGIRQYALSQFGLMSKIVLNSWGIHSTSDFGEIVYNLINVGVLKKSPQDRRSHFDGVYDFDEAFDSAGAVSEAFPTKLASHF